MGIQPLTDNDLHSLADLQPEGWQDIVPTIRFYTGNDFCFPVKVSINDTIVGIGTTIIHHDIAWLAHIIVHPAHRNKGIGKLITQSLVYLSKINRSTTLHLIATTFGEPVYEQVGFETTTSYLFFKDIKAAGQWTISKNIVPFKDDFKAQIARIDREVSGEDRLFHLQQYLGNGYVYLQDNQVAGFYLPDCGEGLITATTDQAGIELMKLRLAKKENASFPADNLAAAAWMEAHGYKAFKTAKRMKLGLEKAWQPANIYNRIGGNLG